MRCKYQVPFNDPCDYPDKRFCKLRSKKVSSSVCSVCSDSVYIYCPVLHGVKVAVQLELF